jgi:P pilus assembly chaperone PapD
MSLALNAHAVNINPVTNTIGLKSTTSTDTSATFMIGGLSEPGTYAVKIFKWSQSANQYQILEDTKDLSYYPQVLQMKKDLQYSIRVFIKPGNELRGDVQKTYRMVISKIEAEQAEKTSMTMGFSLPIFVAPTTPGFSKIETEHVGNKWTFKNTGNETLRVPQYVIDGKTQSLLYILPGSEVSLEGKQVELKN